MAGLRGSFSVGGGSTKYVGHGSMKRPTTTTTGKPVTVAPRSSYQKPSKVVPSSGVAQTKPAPIKGTPKVSTTTTTPTTTTTAKKLSGPIKTIKKIKKAGADRQSMLDTIMSSPSMK